MCIAVYHKPDTRRKELLMKHYFTKNILPAMLVLFLLTGCGEADAQGGQGAQGSQEVGSSFRVERYVSLQWEEQGQDGWQIPVYSGVRGDTLYLLVPENAAGTDRSLYTFCIDNGKTEKAPFSLEIPEIETAAVHSMAVTGEGELTLRLFGALEESGNDTFLCRTDLTGKCLDEETPIREDGEVPPESGRCWTGSDGIALVTESGDSNDTDILRYSLSDQKPDRLATVSGFVNALCSDGQEGIYYIENNYLWHLSAGDESAERLLSMAEAGIELTFDNHLLIDGEGGLAICCVSAGGADIWLLTDGEKVLTADWEEGPGQTGGSVEPESSEQPEPVERETIRIANLYVGNDIVEAVQLWGAKSARYKIQAETAAIGQDQDRDAFRTRTLADIASGNGPELLAVSEDDLYMLAEKGALMDLSDLVPEDIQEQLIPGVRGLGTVDGAWVGLCWKPALLLKFTSDELWSGDSWTVSDIMELAEAREELEWIHGSRDLTFEPQSYEYSLDYSSDSESLLRFLVLNSLGDSPFLDLDNGACYFDGDEFIRVLEFCKRYGQRIGPKDGEEREAMLREGRMLVMGSSLFAGYYSYANLRVRLSGCHPVGVPAEKGSGNYISSGYGYLVVSADATNLEAVKDCIAYLYSYDTQMNSSTVRRDVADDQIVYDELEEGWVMKISGSKMVPDICGTSFKEEYLDLLERLEPRPYCPQAIIDIVTEECSQFFDGGRSAQETAEVIQRRVQLYLDEQ